MILTEINIYPVKSTRRIALDAAEVLARGLRWDRNWMLVDSDGEFITARTHPTLACVDTALGSDSLRISVNGGAAIELPLHSDTPDTLSVRVWRDRCEASPAGREADAWFSDYLGMDCRLVRIRDDLRRDVDPAYGRRGDEVSFADGFPLLVIGAASLRDLNSRLAEPVPMTRFRPNLVVDGAEPYVEDNWRRFRVGAVEFEGVKHCGRCVFTTVDPATGIRDPQQEPLRTLAGYRKTAGGRVLFGQNLIPRKSGVIRIGDRIEILELA
ncbi:MAG: MOSC domain-containing protein [Thiogranum sp.]|nr:MOSC domain-containing protein [Thiogranum sp.]